VGSDLDIDAMAGLAGEVALAILEPVMRACPRPRVSTPRGACQFFAGPPIVNIPVARGGQIVKRFREAQARP